MSRLIFIPEFFDIYFKNQLGCDCNLFAFIFVDFIPMGDRLPEKGVGGFLIISRREEGKVYIS